MADRPSIIAEVAVEHLGSVNVALRCIESAAKCGCDYIKFQHHLPDQEMLPDKINFWGGSLDSILVNYNLSLDDHRLLKKACCENNISYLCTPFSRTAAIQLLSLGCSEFKIGSGEMGDLHLLEPLIREGSFLMVSTGMSTLAEVHNTYTMLKSLKANFSLFNCTSEYPTPIKDTRLSRLSYLVHRYPDILIGQSDHSDSIYSSLAAISMGAMYIEKHFTLTKLLRGPDYTVSIEPSDMSTLCSVANDIYLSKMGEYPEITQKELITRNWAKHTLYAATDLNQGDVLTLENTLSLRPPHADGIKQEDYRKYFGSKINTNLKALSPITYASCSL